MTEKSFATCFDKGCEQFAEVLMTLVSKDDRICNIKTSREEFNKDRSIVLVLSNNIRKTNIQAEKALLARGERFEKVEEERNKPKYHRQAKEVTCPFCGGRGYTEYFPVGSATLTRARCTNCYGRVYTMEHYY